MNWTSLEQSDQLDQIAEESYNQSILIFKHSTRCSISALSLNKLERKWQTEEMKEMKTYFLDLIRHRIISGQISKTFNVPHQSPQVLVIRDGKCIHEASHFGITYDDIRETCKFIHC